jgi:hypothetical protein
LIATAVALAVVAAVLLAASAPAAKPSAGSKPTAAVSIGDSFISGEGGRWLGNSQNPLGDRDGSDRAAFDCGAIGCRHDPARVYGGTYQNGCHRSDVAPIVSAVRAGVRVDEPINIACSGARTDHIWRASSGGASFKGEAPQADQLAAIARRADVRLIVLTAIANDLGFKDHVVACVVAWSTSTPRRPRRCAAEEQAKVRAGLGAARAGLAKDVDEIRAVMAAAGSRPEDYRLMIMSYASPIPHGADMRYPEWGWSRLSRGGCPFWDADADWANDGITPSMASAMGDVAAAKGAEFLDVQRALEGHQVCDFRAPEVGGDGPSEAGSEWARRLIPGCCQGSVQESLHPNAYGQQALGHCIALTYERPAGAGGSCRATPGAGLGAVRVAPLP